MSIKKIKLPGNPTPFSIGVDWSNVSNAPEILTSSDIETIINNHYSPSNAMVFKGTLGTGGTVTALPNNHTEGWLYKVITAGTYAGQSCEENNLIICTQTRTTANNADWMIISCGSSSGSGSGTPVDISGKADINSPAFTGTPTAPTPTAGDSSDKIATTAFVMSAIYGSILITIINGIAGITATATLANGQYSNSATSNSAGIISIPVAKYGEYNITYSDNRVIGDSFAVVNSNMPVTLAARYREFVEYTVRIDETNSNPNTACVYMDDAVGMTKGSSEWDSKPIFEDIRPCVFKNGVVNYYIDPNDFNQKVDINGNRTGETSVLTGADGDVMIEFSKFAYKIKRSGNYLYVSITNNDSIVQNDADYTYDAFSRVTYGDLSKFYQGAFKGYVNSGGHLHSYAGVQPSAFKTIGQARAAAQDRNTVNGALKYHYQQSTYAHLKALWCLYIIKYANLDGQSALGPGASGFTDDGASNLALVTGYNATADDSTITGTMDSTTSTLNKGMCWAGTSTQHMKLFGIEDFWGSIWEWVDGAIIDSNRKIVTSWNNFTGEPTTATSITTNTGLTSQISGFIKKMAGTSDSGFCPIQVGASSSTYWCDYGVIISSVFSYGGRWSDGAYVGPFFIIAYLGTSASQRDVGCRLTYN